VLRRGWFPANLRPVRTSVGALPPPLVRGVIGALDAAYSHGLAGRSGRIRTGEGSHPDYKFSGYVAYTGSAVIAPGASSNLRRGPDTILPATSGDVRTLAGSVQDHLAQLTPKGWRRR
jgi:hypothetical protein